MTWARIALLLASPAVAAAGDLDAPSDLLGLDAAGLAATLGGESACQVELLGPPGCTMFSCCEPLGKRIVDAVCGSARVGGERVDVAAVLVGEPAVVRHVVLDPRRPRVEAWVASDELHWLGGGRLMALQGGLLADVGPDDALLRLTVVDPADPNQQAACRTGIGDPRVRRVLPSEPPRPGLGAIRSTPPR